MIEALMRAHRYGIVFCTVALLIGHHTSAQSSSSCPEPTVHTVAALQVRLAALQNARSIAERCELAQLKLLTGQTDEAVALLEGVLKTQPRNVEAIIVVGRAHAREGRGAQVNEQLQRAMAINTNHPAVRVFWAERKALGAPAEALPVFEKIVNDHPGNLAARVGTARVLYRLNRDADAQAQLDRILARDSMYAPAHLLKSELYLRALDQAAREKFAHRALELDSLSTGAQLAVSRIRRERDDVEGAYTRLIAVLALDPVHIEAHRALGNGGALKSYGRYPTLEDDSVPADLARRLDAADSLLLLREYDRAEAAFNDVLKTHPGLAIARLGIASAYYYRGRFDTAFQRFLDITRDHPGLGLAHYGVSESDKHIRMQRDPRNLQALARFQVLPRPEEPERLRDVFTDFNRLDNALQKIVLLSVAPLSNYVPIVSLSGGSHYLLPFHHRLWNWRGTAQSRGRRSFDGRLWDDVKGQGGRNAVSGEELTREVVLERYNILALEFMHQVHAVLSPAQRDTIHALYQAARRERRMLDSYAGSNPNEYLAQAYEAFISRNKETRGGTSGNTRDRLRELDPRMYAFLEQINAQASYRPLAVQALLNRLNMRAPDILDTVEREANWILNRYGEGADILGLEAGIARLRGDYTRAAAWHTRAIALAPDQFNGYADLADNYVLSAHDHKRAAEVITRYLQRDSSSYVAHIALARYSLFAGDIVGAQRALDRVGTLRIKAAATHIEEILLRAEHARLSGEPATARRAYRLVADSLQPQNLRARAELALLAIRDNQPAQAEAWLGPVRDSGRADPLVREAEARLLALNGGGAQALGRLTQLRAAEPARLETITAMIAIARKVRPVMVAELIAIGRSIAQQPVPVATVFEQNRFVARAGVLTARARMEFEAETKQR
ncbi:MAG: tetratricopeptide repeat protein [Pseudomonas sp.]